MKKIVALLLILGLFVGFHSEAYAVLYRVFGKGKTETMAIQLKTSIAGGGVATGSAVLKDLGTSDVVNATITYGTTDGQIATMSGVTQSVDGSWWNVYLTLFDGNDTNPDRLSVLVCSDTSCDIWAGMETIVRGDLKIW